MQLDALAFLPHPTDITDIAPPPDHSPLFASIRWPGQAGLTSAGSVAAGSDGCLLGRIHFPCGFVVYVLLCCWGVFPVLTLYSPRSIVWELFFFSSLSSCKCCIFLQFYLHFTTDYTCMIVYVTNNKEPEPEIVCYLSFLLQWWSLLKLGWCFSLGDNQSPEELFKWEEKVCFTGEEVIYVLFKFLF